MLNASDYPMHFSEFIDELNEMIENGEVSSEEAQDVLNNMTQE